MNCFQQLENSTNLYLNLLQMLFHCPINHSDLIIMHFVSCKDKEIIDDRINSRLAKGELIASNNFKKFGNLFLLFSNFLASLYLYLLPITMTIVLLNFLIDANKEN